MANGKKAFIAYCDWGIIFNELEDEEAGKLVKHLFDYVNDKNPVPVDRMTKMMFIQIQQQLKRDLSKYEERAERSRENGKLGGRPKNLKEPKKPTRLNNNPTEPKKPDTDTDTVTVTVKDTVIVKDINKRKAEFGNSLHPFLNKYEAPLLNEFFGYWTEHGEKDKKMRFEKEKSFGLSRRLSTWKKLEKNFAPKKDKTMMLADKMKQDYGIN